MCKKNKTSKKKKKTVYVDDGHTVYDMSGVSGKKKKEDDLGLSRKERRAVIKAAFATYLPILVGVLACFTLAALLMYFWLL